MNPFVIWLNVKLSDGASLPSLVDICDPVPIVASSVPMWPDGLSLLVEIGGDGSMLNITLFRVEYSLP